MLLIRHKVVLACGFFAWFTPLMAGTAAAAGAVTLQWTAPGDDGTLGRAQAYIIRYSKTPITAANFTSATLVVGVPAPKPAGTREMFTVKGLTAGTNYYFAIITTDDWGNWSLLSNVVSSAAQTVGVEDGPLTLDFSAPWPNPARQSMRCAFTLPEAAMVQVEVFDVAGRHVRTMARGWHDAGRGELDWDLRDDSGRPADAGVYLVRARLGATTWSKRLVVAN